MKAKREHRVPLSEGALAVLREMEKQKSADTDYVLPGRKKGASMSNMAMLALLRRMKRDDVTAHGFRAGRSAVTPLRKERPCDAQRGNSGE
jgi:integrase